MLGLAAFAVVANDSVHAFVKCLVERKPLLTSPCFKTGATLAMLRLTHQASTLLLIPVVDNEHTRITRHVLFQKNVQQKKCHQDVTSFQDAGGLSRHKLSHHPTVLLLNVRKQLSGEGCERQFGLCEELAAEGDHCIISLPVFVLCEGPV